MRDEEITFERSRVNLYLIVRIVDGEVAENDEELGQQQRVVHGQLRLLGQVARQPRDQVAGYQPPLQTRALGAQQILKATIEYIFRFPAF